MERVATQTKLIYEKSTQVKVKQYEVIKITDKGTYDAELYDESIQNRRYAVDPVWVAL